KNTRAYRHSWKCDLYRLAFAERHRFWLQDQRSSSRGNWIVVSVKPEYLLAVPYKNLLERSVKEPGLELTVS
ncbi:MAG: hypothetical protein ABH838_00260, partial [Actinomycetota bacterium]